MKHSLLISLIIFTSMIIAGPRKSTCKISDEESAGKEWKYIHHSIDKIIYRSAENLLFTKKYNQHTYDLKAAEESGRTVLSSTLQTLKNFSVDNFNFQQFAGFSFYDVISLPQESINYSLDQNFGCSIMKNLAMETTVKGTYIVQMRGALQNKEQYIIIDGSSCGPHTTNFQNCHEETLFTHRIFLSPCETIDGEKDRESCL
ncbi:hypothetical protein N9N67_11640 [Bacteriovoracaceae bacterium]|nr:hypothetical protein [Bacteriovoracaceae bacterium]